MRNSLLTLGAAACLLAAGCAAPRNARPASPAAPAPYIRIVHPDSNTVQLQIALRKFVPAQGRGPDIWLAGTSHIGDPAYYRSLQMQLDARTVVLFEGINTEAHPRRVPKPGDSPLPPPRPMPKSDPADTNQGYSMQSTLAKSLGLVFQLDAIDYDHTNFLNSDLSLLQIQRLMIGDPTAELAAPGEEGASDTSFNNLLQVMDGSSFLGSLFKMGLQIIGSSPNLQAITRLTFIETLGRLKGDFAGMKGLPPDMQHMIKILIESRNQNVIDDLKTELTLVPRSGSIAVFYGTGHMDDLQRRLVSSLHYQPAGDLWLTAFAVDLRQTGLSPGQVRSLSNLIQWQMDQMQ